MRLIAEISSLRRSDVQAAGGKAAWLGEIAWAGFSVPSGFVVLAPAYEKFIADAQSNREIETILNSFAVKEPEALDRAAARLEALITAASLPDELVNDISLFASSLPGERVAVRSSAIEEDSHRSSWAGQLDTFLDVEKGQVPYHVKRCWASLFSRRAILYRQSRGLGLPLPAVPTIFRAPRASRGRALPRVPLARAGFAVSSLG